jgi:methylglutaconyl-CoA hydratase
MSELVLYEVKGPAAVVTLNRADRRNALSRALIREIGEAVARAESDQAARVMILTGAGGSFCAGMDLAELQESMGASEDESPVWEDAQRLGAVYEKIYRCSKPTIAAVTGAAVAGGAGLASVCDLCVCDEGSKLGYPEVRRGLVAAMVMPHLLRHVGERMARWLLLTGEMITAAEAERAGLVNAVAEKGKVMDTALAWARMLAEGGPRALALTKDLLGRFSGQALSVTEAARASAAPRLTDECRQGLEAFFSKKPAPWSPG